MTTTLILFGILSSAPIEPMAATEPAADPAPGPMISVPRSEPEPEPRRGIGMLVSGGLVLGLVVAPMLLVTVFDSAAAVECRHSENECWGGFMLQFSLPVMVTGLAIGAPLLAAGVQRKNAWQAWRSNQRVALRPRFSPGRNGVTAGLELRF